ncbi:MAG: heme o synthase [Acidimicrobiales bacterium]|jgi:protoheme IX farnesyltransferase
MLRPPDGAVDGAVSPIWHLSHAWPANLSQVVSNAGTLSAGSVRPGPGYLARLAAFVALTKPRIIELLLITTVPTMFVAARGWPSLGLVLATLAGGTLSAGSANAANMYLDRDIDALMRRTARRPLVTGAVSAPAALAFALGLQLAAFATLWLAVNPLSAVLALSAALFYVFVYTALLKRVSSQNIVIGGAAGAVPVLVGWAAVKGSLGWAPFLLFILVVLWTPPHFWALAIRYRDDYANAKVPMMPVVQSIERTTRHILAYCVATVAASAAFGVVAHMYWAYWAVAALAGAGFVGLCVRLMVARTAAVAMKVFHWSITYLSLLFVAMALDVLVR